jgi:hypothetical protein
MYYTLFIRNYFFFMATTQHTATRATTSRAASTRTRTPSKRGVAKGATQGAASVAAPTASRAIKSATKKTSASPRAKSRVSRTRTAQCASHAHPAACAQAVAPQAQCFWVYNGPVVDSLPHLIEALKAMTKEQYDYHATGEHNDFATWVRDVFGCDECAAKLERVRSKTGAIQALKALCA